MTTGNPLFINRILVAIDPSTEQLRTLEAAADLAALMQAELHGLFVESPALRQLEQLSSSRKIDLPQGFGARIEKGSIQREVEPQTRRFEEILARASEQRHLEWSYHVVRGRLDEQLAEAVGEGDLVVAESAGRTIRSGMRMRPSTRRMAELVSHPVLFLQHGPRPTQSIVAVYDGGPESEAILDAALTFVGGPVSLLTVLLPAETREESDELKEAVDSRLAQENTPVHYRRISPESIEWVVNALEEVHGDILIQGENNESLKDGGLEELLDNVRCPVLIVR